MRRRNNRSAGPTGRRFGRQKKVRSVPLGCAVKMRRIVGPTEVGSGRGACIPIERSVEK